mmetsp:Transcript_116078/g.335255  ORF Transcript_116078/g.335255 Transcript_116078/m.335255 type:complete len:352 (+) Transcript_116078:105-1160(+)|eukprot:CAMPEP_0176076348 /NCGR_PEP_ID=MMETSP0120_2-20121206/38166_1 /TAXON_ID=160619 /ORGANISM="Kryptoperidinium foliaceum, Strain CCMP 1326" /LENGTH=351 /DNA_ID=CAMNT_0017410065 /DNA_START=99 /DNA_END=1154 /DNA_ORIENTATION=-
MAPIAGDEDYYRLLGVGHHAGDAEIAKAYKKLALRYHPDKNPDDPETAAQMFKRISEAYSVLGDLEKRRRYDLLGTEVAHLERPRTAEPADDLFSDFFASSSSRPMPHPGRSFASSKDFASRGGGAKLGKEDPFSFFASTHGGRGNIDDLRSSMFRRSASGAAGAGGFRRPSAVQPSWFRTSAPDLPRSPDWAIPCGKSVTIRDLAMAPEHNGKVGTVLRFDEARERYDVEVVGAGKLSLRPKNVTQRSRVEVVDVDSKPELCGKTGDVLAFDTLTGHYTVMLQHPPSVIVLPRGNCRLPEGARVLTMGLSVDRYNGRMAKIVAVDAFSRRYQLQFASGEEVKVKFDKVAC